MNYILDIMNPENADQIAEAFHQANVLAQSNPHWTVPHKIATMADNNLYQGNVFIRRRIFEECALLKEEILPIIKLDINIIEQGQNLTPNLKEVVFKYHAGLLLQANGFDLLNYLHSSGIYIIEKFREMAQVKHLTDLERETLNNIIKVSGNKDLILEDNMALRDVKQIFIQSKNIFRDARDGCKPIVEANSEFLLDWAGSKNTYDKSLNNGIRTIRDLNTNCGFDQLFGGVKSIPKIVQDFYNNL